MTLPFADTAHLFLLENEGIVFSESAQTLHSLNTAAAMVWCWMEEGITGDALVANLGEALATDKAKAEAHIENLLGEWRALGLLAGTPAPEAEGPTPWTPPELPPLADRSNCAEAHFRLLGSTVKVRCDNDGQLDRIRPVLAHLSVSDSGEPDVIVDVVDVAGEQLLYLDSGPVWRYAGLSAIAPSVKGVVWRATVNRFPHFLDIHAGVVATDDFCIVLPAAPGSGKSTLTAALTHAGYHYYSDEVALLLDDSLDVEPVPLGVCIKDTGLDVLSPFYPGVAELQPHDRIDGKTVRYMPPPVPEGSPARPALPAGAIIFPKYAADAVTQLIPLGKVAALHKLMDECVSISEPLTFDRVKRLVDWIGNIPCFDLPMSGPEEAVAAIKATL